EAPSDCVAISSAPATPAISVVNKPGFETSVGRPCDIADQITEISGIKAMTNDVHTRWRQNSSVALRRSSITRETTYMLPINSTPPMIAKPIMLKDSNATSVMTRARIADPVAAAIQVQVGFRLAVSESKRDF